MEQKPFYLTTAIAYVNAPPHIGFALELIYADALARYERLLGRDVQFVTGTDEHGQKIAHKAAEAGKSPGEFVDMMAEEYRALAKSLNVSNGDFIRTTEKRHARAVETFWETVMENGHIFKKKYRGLYCVGCEQFKTEKELVDGKCPDHHTRPEPIEEENYFFRLSSFQTQLKELFASHPQFVIPDAKFNEAKQLVEGGLEDISISRSKKHLTWGLPVPGDDSQVVYVWFDALVNYLTAIGFPDKAYSTVWPADVHIIGKEINRFHTVLWPAMLMAAGIDPPTQVAVHGWITVDGQKMSKTLGNVIDPDDVRMTFGTDALRYLLLREIPFAGDDGDYSHKRFMARYQADLANDLGNLVYRVTSMLQKYREGRVPEKSSEVSSFKFQVLSETWEKYHELMRALKFDQALAEVWRVVMESNQFVDRSKPWALAKSGEDSKLDEVLYQLLETIRQIAWMVRPVMPETSDKMLDQLGQHTKREGKTFDEVSAWGGLEPGMLVGVGEPLFPRIEE